MTGSDPYAIVDPVLRPWAERHGVHVYTLHQDDPVRLVEVFDRAGQKRAQIYVDVPGQSGEVSVVAVMLDPSRPSKWNVRRREKRRAGLAALEAALEELRLVAFRWAGPGAFTG